MNRVTFSKLSEPFLLLGLKGKSNVVCLILCGEKAFKRGNAHMELIVLCFLENVLYHEAMWVLQKFKQAYGGK